MSLPATPGLLRVAVPNKGSLSQAATDMLVESGYRQRQDSKTLTLTDTDNGVEFFYLRPRDIALYVGEGTLDVGITGRHGLRHGRVGVFFASIAFDLIRCQNVVRQQFFQQQAGTGAQRAIDETGVRACHVRQIAQPQRIAWRDHQSL